MGCLESEKAEKVNMDERIEMYQRMTGFTPSIFQQDLIQDRVKDLARWKKAIVFWCSNLYRPQSVGKVLDYYDQLAVTARPAAMVGRHEQVSEPIELDFCPFCHKGRCSEHNVGMPKVENLSNAVQ